MKENRFDSVQPLGKPRLLPNGFLVISARVGRSGVLTYRNADGSMRREYRSPEENFSPESLETYKTAVVTDDHPSELVTAENAGDLSRGFVVGEIRRDGVWNVAEIVITDKALIEKGQKEKNSVSLGYTQEFDATPGISPEGERYDGQQRKIVINHIAIVEKARAGELAKARFDACDLDNEAEKPASPKVETMSLKKIVVTLDGVQREIEVSPEGERALVQLQARCDALGSEINKIKSAQSEIPALVKARVALERQAIEIDPEMRLDNKSDQEIKSAIVAKLNPSLRLDNKSADYVSAAYDAVLSMRNASPDPSLALARGVPNAPQNRADSDDDPAAMARLKWEQHALTMHTKPA